MKKHIQILLMCSIILAILSIVWHTYNAYMYTTIPAIISRNDIYGDLIFYGFWLFFISHLVLLATAFVSLKNTLRKSALGIIILVYGTVSFFFMFIHRLILHETWDSYRFGYTIDGSIGPFLWFVTLFSMIFFASALVYFIVIIQSGNKTVLTKSLHREKTFVAMHILGIVCGVLGVFIVLAFLGQLKERHFLVRFLLGLYVFVVLPYIVALAAWVVAYLRDKHSGVKDEKQVSDLNKSGMLSFQISMLLIIVMTFYGFLRPDPKCLWYNFSGLVPVLWLPFIFYVALVVFSVASLYNFKRN